MFIDFLQVFGVQPKDVGTYKCTANNAAGSSFCTASVTIGAAPYMPSHPTVTAVTGTAVHLEWSPPELGQGHQGRCELTFDVEVSHPHSIAWEKVCRGLSVPETVLTGDSALRPGEPYLLRVVSVVTSNGEQYPGPPSDIVQIPLGDLLEAEEEEDSEEEELWKEGFTEQFQVVEELGR